MAEPLERLQQVAIVARNFDHEIVSAEPELLVHSLRVRAGKDVLIEIGVSRDVRPDVVGLVDGSGVVGQASATIIANARRLRSMSASTATIAGVGHAPALNNVATRQANIPGRCL